MYIYIYVLYKCYVYKYYMYNVFMYITGIQHVMLVYNAIIVCNTVYNTYIFEVDSVSGDPCYVQGRSAINLVST